jgi:hypothetical protein
MSSKRRGLQCAGETAAPNTSFNDSRAVAVERFRGPMRRGKHLKASSSCREALPPAMDVVLRERRVAIVRANRTPW